MGVMSVYQATLTFRAPLLLYPSRGGADVSLYLPLAGGRLPLTAWHHHRERLRQAAPVGELDLRLYPRTDAEGYLWRGTALASWREPTDEPPERGLHALGKLLRVDLKEALLVLLILPNPKGQLTKPFALPLVASLELLESLPKVGGGLEVWGELKTRSGRVVVTRAEAVTLPPVRERPKQARDGPTPEVLKAE